MTIPARHLTRALLIAALALCLPTATHAQATAPTDLDRLMERVLANRDVVAAHLRDYVLDEREQFALVGPSGGRLFGQDRTYAWCSRDGIGVRSPVTANGVIIPEGERRQYEEEWFARERVREKNARERREAGTSTAVSHAPDATTTTPSGRDQASSPVTPRFISEAYFLNFRFEPGNYFFAGTTLLEGQTVYRVEYLPSKLYGSAASGSADPLERDINRKMNKVALVTLWIDPAAEQIVRYDFDNVEFGFLPGRSLARVDGARAGMEMSRVLDGVWLPRVVTMDGAVTLATGTFRLDYSRTFSNYRRGSVTSSFTVRER